MAEGGWLVESVSTFLFTPSQLPISAFRDLTGSEPARSPSGRPAEGPFRGAWLWLAESMPRGRVQVAITPVPVDDRSVEGAWPYHIGELATRLPQLEEVTLDLVRKLEPALLWRLGLAVSLLHPVASVPAAYEWLTSRAFLPFRPDGDAVDFMYRINRPAPARERMPPAHRLRTFSVESIRGPVAASPSGVACRLEIDINTVQTHPLNSQRHSFEEILQTFAAWAVAIAQRGDFDDRSPTVR